MFSKGFSEDQDVIHEHNYNPFINELFENVIHHCLEGCWTVCEAEENDKGLIQATVGLEGCFPLISFFYMHIVVPPVNVKLCEVLSLATCNFIHNVWHQR